MTDEVSDDVAMLRLACGDVDSITILFLRYNESLVRILNSKLRDFAAAEDAAQTAWLRVQEFASEYSPNNRFFSWIKKIAINSMIDAKRRDRSRKLTLSEPLDGGSLVELIADDTIDPIENMITHEIAERIESLLPTIPEDQQTVFTLHVFSGLTMAEIASRLEESKATIKSRYRLAKRKLLGEYSRKRASGDNGNGESQSVVRENDARCVS